MDASTLILLVDDVPANNRLLEAILEPCGYETVSVESGAAALTRVSQEPVDLVLLDAVMPGIDGYEVCRRLRDGASTRLLPVVMITASGGQAKAKAIEAGADDFIAKPLDQDELLARVRSLLRIKRYHDTIERQAAELAAWNQTLSERVEERTRELEGARAQILELYQELARRNRELHELLERMSAGAGRRSEPSPAARLVEKLTPREREVLERLAQGRTNGAIAAELVVSAATVKFHVENIIAKLGVADRTQAAVRAVELGLLGNGPPDAATGQPAGAILSG
jgi:DNA-binding NarL/FixJ family response regulator